MYAAGRRGPTDPYLTALLPVHEAAAAGVWGLMAGGSGPEAPQQLPFLGDQNASAPGTCGGNRSSVMGPRAAPVGVTRLSTQCIHDAALGLQGRSANTPTGIGATVAGHRDNVMGRAHTVEVV